MTAYEWAVMHEKFARLSVELAVSHASMVGIILVIVCSWRYPDWWFVFIPAVFVGCRYFTADVRAAHKKSEKWLEEVRNRPVPDDTGPGW